jgi:hypothetical protein
MVESECETEPLDPLPQCRPLLPRVGGFDRIPAQRAGRGGQHRLDVAVDKPIDRTIVVTWPRGPIAFHTLGRATPRCRSLVVLHSHAHAQTVSGDHEGTASGDTAIVKIVSGGGSNASPSARG